MTSKSEKSFISPAKREFTLYKKGMPVTTGTIKAIAKFLGVKENTVRFYGAPSYRKRTSENAMRLIEITGWDEDE